MPSYPSALTESRDGLREAGSAGLEAPATPEAVYESDLSPRTPMAIQPCPCDLLAVCYLLLTKASNPNSPTYYCDSSD
jgi:hypothetical protein